MAEILYIQRHHDICQTEALSNIRWLEAQDYPVFCEHLALCGQKSISTEIWREIFQEGTMYCGVFVEGKMVARAAAEKTSAETWEVADVRTANEYRLRGYAQKACRFVLDYILHNGKNATMRTEEDNDKMRHIIETLGFVPADV